ncbi:MAG TPA: DNA polymerase subunit beta [Clostridiales bacterium]|nr:DNA polymerase subunit beta [Clostridiales bacterium]
MTDHTGGFRKLARICQAHNLGLVYLFGSMATQGERLLEGTGSRPAPDDPLADLDVGVVTLEGLPAPGQRHRFYGSLYNSLEELFTPLPLDLVLLEENHSVFQAEAVAGICVYEISEKFRDSYEMNVLRRAADFRPVLRRFHREILEEV